MSKLLCIYHGGCDDGFGAAWAVRHALGAENVEFHAGIYQSPPPDVTGRYVLLVDFSYKRPMLLEMGAKARSILILDHHKSAAEDLAGFFTPPAWGAWRTIDGSESAAIRIAALFDMNRSGAGMAWDYFHDSERPDFINYIEDRDLWRKSLLGGDEFTIALRSYPQNFEVWDDLVKDGPGRLIAEGKSIQRYYRLRCEELKRHAYLAWFQKATFGETHDIGPFAICNAPYAFASEVAGELCARNGAMFGASYFEVEPGKFQYSLRSRGDFDVSEVAKRFGGGGHKNAAGFSTFGMVHISESSHD